MNPQEIFEYFESELGGSFPEFHLDIFLPNFKKKFEDKISSYPKGISSIFEQLLLLKNVVQINKFSNNHIEVKSEWVRLELYMEQENLKINFELENPKEILNSLAIIETFPLSLRKKCKIRFASIKISLEISKELVEILDFGIKAIYDVYSTLGIFTIKSISLILLIDPSQKWHEAIDGEIDFDLGDFNLISRINGLKPPCFAYGIQKNPLSVEKFTKFLFKEQFSLPEQIKKWSLEDIKIFADFEQKIYYANASLVVNLEIFPDGWCSLEKASGSFAKTSDCFDFKFEFKGNFLKFPFNMTIYRQHNFFNQKRWVIELIHTKQKDLDQNIVQMSLVSDKNISNSMKSIADQVAFINDCISGFTKEKNSLDKDLIDFSLDKPITAFEILETLKLRTFFDLDKYLDPEITKNISLEECSLAIKEKQLESFLLGIRSKNQWKIFDFLVIQNLFLRVHWNKNKGVQSFLIRADFNNFILAGVYEKNGFIFYGELHPKQTMNPLKMISDSGIQLPEFLTKLTNFVNGKICFSKKKFFMICLEAETDLKLIDFGDKDSIIKLNKYEVDFMNNLETREVQFQIIGDMTVFELKLLFTVQIKSKDDFLLEAKLKENHNLFSFLSKVDKKEDGDDDFKGIELYKDSLVQFDMKEKTIFFQAKSNFGNVFLTLFKETYRWGFEVIYQMKDEKDEELFKLFDIESINAKFCNQDSCRLNKKKGKTLEIKLNLEANIFTQGIFKCIRAFKKDFPSTLDVIFEKGQTPRFKLSKDLAFTFDLEFFKMSFSNIAFLKKGFECDIEFVATLTPKHVFTFKFKLIYQNKILKGSYKMVSLNFQLLPGLKVLDLSFEGQFWPKRALSFASRCKLLDYSDDLILELMPPPQIKFTLKFPVDFELKLSNLFKMVFDFDTPEFLDIIRIQPIEKGKFIIFSFMGIMDVEMQGKLVILEFIKINFDIKICVYRGIDTKFSIDPIIIGNFLKIAAADTNEKGPSFSLQILPFEKKYEVKIQGRFEFLGLRLVTYCELGFQGIEFRLEAGFHLGSLIGIENNFNVIIKKGSNFYFKNYFRFYLNIETPEVEIFGFTIQKIRLCGVDFRALIELNEGKFKIEGGIALYIFGIEVSFDIKIEIDICEFKRIPIEIAKWIWNNWWKILKNIGKMVVELLCDVFLMIGKAIVLLFTNPLKFIQNLLSFKFGLADGDGDQNSNSGHSKGKTNKKFDVKAAQNLLEDSAKECIINENYDDAFVLYEACDAASENLNNQNVDEKDCRILTHDDLLERMSQSKDPWKKAAYCHQLSKIAEDKEIAKVYEEEKNGNINEGKKQEIKKMLEKIKDDEDPKKKIWKINPWAGIDEYLQMQNENRINFVKIDKFLVVSQIKNNDKNEEIGNLVEEKENALADNTDKKKENNIDLKKKEPLNYGEPDFVKKDKFVLGNEIQNNERNEKKRNETKERNLYEEKKEKNHLDPKKKKPLTYEEKKNQEKKSLLKIKNEEDKNDIKWKDQIFIDENKKNQKNQPQKDFEKYEDKKKIDSKFSKKIENTKEKTKEIFENEKKKLEMEKNNYLKGKDQVNEKEQKNSDEKKNLTKNKETLNKTIDFEKKMPNEKNSSIAIPKFKDEDEKLTNNKNSGSLALPIFKDKDEKSPEESDSEEKPEIHITEDHIIKYLESDNIKMNKKIENIKSAKTNGKYSSGEDKDEKEEKQDGCTCGKPRQPKKVNNFWKLEPMCICGKDGKPIVKKGGTNDNIYGFGN